MLSEKDFDNPHSGVEIKLDSELKKWLVEYVGNRLAIDDGIVTPDMVVGVMANEFPEFLWLVAEENYMRGYDQALIDLGEKK